MRSTTFMQIAFLVAQESKCCSWKVGAVIEKNDRIIATGYNGSPAGQPNCCDVAVDKGWAVRTGPTGQLKLVDVKRRMEHSAWSNKNEIHAELNSILFAARNGIISLEGSTMYVTLSPCENCSKMITQSGIKKIVYCEEYDQNSQGWSRILLDAGIEVYKIDKSKLRLLNWEAMQTEPQFVENDDEDYKD